MLNSPPMTSPSRRILLVDSDPVHRESLKKLISSWDYDVLGHDKSVDSRILETDPAVIINRLSPSSTNGFEVLREVKAHHARIPVIILAESGTIELAMRAIQEEG